MAAGTSGGSAHAHIYVERVVLRNFRGIERLAVDLRPGLTLLVGRNNAGKSRILRALHVAIGGVPAERDDLTVGLDIAAEIDVVIAPRPSAPGADDGQQAKHDGAPEPAGQTFTGQLQRLLGVGIALTSSSPARQRFAWRTTIVSVSDGRGAQARTNLLSHDANTGGWDETSTSLPRSARELLYAELVDTRRDLDAELRQRGTAIRRILSDLQVSSTQRDALERELARLGDDILQHSDTLRTLRTSLSLLDRYVDALGEVCVDPVPRTLEELARAVGVSFGSGADSLASRLHGSGVRSLASLLAQDLFYSQTLGVDGGDIRPHPVTLVEEPESHLHPHAIIEVAGLLSAERRQVVATTHSPLLAASVAPESLRLVRRDRAGLHQAVDFGPAESRDHGALRTKQPSLYASEMEKLTRLVERPFGELLFARAVVIGDGATERAFLPPVLRDALGSLAHGVSVIDSAGMNADVVQAVVKFARHVEIPVVVFADNDAAGRQAVRALAADGTLDESSEVVWSSADQADLSSPETGAATERMMISAAPEACFDACRLLNASVERDEDLLEVMKGLKGSIGGVLASAFIERSPYVDGSRWPEPLRQLTDVLRAKLSSDSDPEAGAA
ncbi:ATP-dependent nuclease [Candidatus Poriferisodalis sp.]|uniref:ATP-dependent nuclease n=1 Tax=Candidatus Poriferisodalis sp. TaxID=3101277 RepID=UPI003B01A799